MERVRQEYIGFKRARALTASEEHKAILKAVLNKDEERRKNCNEHIFKSMENIEHQGLEKLMEKHGLDQ